MQLQLHLHSHNCSWRPCCYFALWPVLQNLLRFHNFWATWLLLKLVGLHTGCWGEEVVLKWVEDDITYRWSGGLAENCPQNGDGHCMNNYGRHSADPSWVAACLICSLYSGGSHAGAHSCPEIEKGFCRAIASGSSSSCPPGRKSLTRPCCGRMHACVICEGEVVHSCPPGFRWMGVAWRLRRLKSLRALNDI